MRLRYLALGDSYTIGEGVSATERWPVQLATAARAAGVPLGDPEIVAKTGWTTTELLGALDVLATSLRADYDLVSLLVGVNDQYRALGAQRFRGGLVKLLSRAVSYARKEPARVLAISIPDWGVTPFAEKDPRESVAIANEIDDFNELIRQEVRVLGATFVDVTSASRSAARDRALVAADGLHPSAAMYAEWVRIILPEALRAIARSQARSGRT